MGFQTGEELAQHGKGFLPFLPGVHHGNIGNRLFNGSLLLNEADRLLEQPCWDMFALGDKGALAPLENRELLFHVGVELVLPLGKLRPVAKNIFCR